MGKGKSKASAWLNEGTPKKKRIDLLVVRIANGDVKEQS